ncbi:hypothetical protein ACU4GI_24895 [Cupriavidus basilensis]|uniref:hypothetical protein n=1 Tax=unclassified Cupriavidus TaxID=2640874 RepID=UPI0006918BBC|nr:hypothetical protein [Cupriavidus sp. SK-3]
MRRYPLPLATMLSVALAVAGALGPPAVVQAAPTADARIVVEATNGQLKALKGKVFDKACNESVDYDATVIDLNGDGQPEVFTNLYGTCVGGMAGVFMQLYIKDANGQWKPQFGFPGQPEALKSKNLGFPDIAVGGPGTCFPVWRWNGKEYAPYKKCR